MIEAPSNWDKEISQLREIIKTRLNIAMENIIRDEIEKILGRVKIITQRDLRGQYEWFIESERKD